MTQNDPESTGITFFGRNRVKPVFSVKIGRNQLFRSKPSFSSQNQPKPLFFRPKSAATGFFGQNRPKPPVWPKSNKISHFDQNQYFQSKSTKPTFFRPKLTKTSLSIKSSFFRSKSTKTSLFGENQPRPVFSVENPPPPVFLAKFDQNKFFQPKLNKTTLSGRKTEKRKQPNGDGKEINKPPFSSVLLPKS